jgi:predicted 5'-methylthioadenosine/S-adenosylhomocysteine nucleosidase
MAADAPAILIAMALPAEAAGVFESAGVEVLFTGVGKVNAAVTLTRYLVRLRHESAGPPLVLNFGTAGSARIPARTLVACRRFVDRDMNVSALGFAHGETPFDELPPTLEFPGVFTDLPRPSAAPATRSRRPTTARPAMSSTWRPMHWRRPASSRARSSPARNT